MGSFRIYGVISDTIHRRLSGRKFEGIWTSIYKGIPAWTTENDAKIFWWIHEEILEDIPSEISYGIIEEILEWVPGGVIKETERRNH